MSDLMLVDASVELEKNPGNRGVSRGKYRGGSELGITRCETVRVPLDTTVEQSDAIISIREFYGSVYRSVASFGLKNPGLMVPELRDIAKRFGMCSEAAWAIGAAAKDLVNLDKRTREYNVERWEEDLEKDDLPLRERHRILQKIEDAKESHVVFGGVKLAREVTKGRLKEKWSIARGFAQFQGRPVKNSNDILRVNRDLKTVTIRDPQASHIEIGSVNLKGRALQLVSYFQENERAIAANLVPVFSRKGKLRRWELHLSFQLRDGEVLDRIVPSPNVVRVSGVDFNAGHFDSQLMDEHGNRVRMASTYTYSGTKNLGETVSHYLDKCVDDGVSVIYIEKLKGLTRKKGKSRGKKLNRKVNQLPTREFRRLIESGAARRGILVVEVEPAFTSKNVPQWSDKFGFGHHGAAALIARKGLGLTIARKKVKSQGGKSLSSRASTLAKIHDWRARIHPTMNNNAPLTRVGASEIAIS